MDEVNPIIVFISLAGASLIIFVLIVAPIWLFLHYRERAQKLTPPLPRPALSNSDLSDLARLAERFEHRLDAMETLMDAERPDWRR